MSNICKEIHDTIENLPVVNWEFKPKDLPKCGIYFFYEDSEYCSHFNNRNRIVRIGTHLKNNFRSRIKNHYVFKNEILFTKEQSAPHDRSIFRNHIGRCLLNREGNIQYVKNVWIKNKSPLSERNKYKHLRDIPTEVRLEKEISNIIRKNFYFRYIIIEDEKSRIGADSLETALIATVAQCNICKPSKSWLGNFSTEETIKSSGLWNIRCVKAPIITNKQLEYLYRAIDKTLKLT